MLPAWLCCEYPNARDDRASLKTSEMQPVAVDELAPVTRCHVGAVPLRHGEDSHYGVARNVLSAERDAPETVAWDAVGVSVVHDYITVGG